MFKMLKVLCTNPSCHIPLPHSCHLHLQESGRCKNMFIADLLLCLPSRVGRDLSGELESSSVSFFVQNNIHRVMQLQLQALSYNNCYDYLTSNHVKIHLPESSLSLSATSLEKQSAMNAWALASSRGESCTLLRMKAFRALATAESAMANQLAFPAKNDRQRRHGASCDIAQRVAPCTRSHY